MLSSKVSFLFFDFFDANRQKVSQQLKMRTDEPAPSLPRDDDDDVSCTVSTIKSNFFRSRCAFALFSQNFFPS